MGFAGPFVGGMTGYCAGFCPLGVSNYPFPLARVWYFRSTEKTFADVI